MKNIKIFDPEFMVKKKLRPPKCIVRNRIKDRMFGIISPSKMCWQICLGNFEVYDYIGKQLKYMCWKRKLSRSGWKQLYRIIRERRKHEYTD